MPDHTEDDNRYKRFQQSSIFIHKQLEQIADITMKMAEIGIADSSNPHFNSIMRNHEKLLEEMKTNDEIKQFMKEHNINYDVINSPESMELAKAVGGIKSIPTMFLIDKKNSIFQKYVGIVPNEMMEIDIKKVLEK